jgi:pyruvate,water dikinase
VTQNSTRGYTRHLDSLGRDDVDLAGGKGANLGALDEAGLPIPPGFVVTTAVYRALTDDAVIRSAIDRLESFGATDSEARTSTAAEVRSLLQNRTFDAQIERAVTEGLDTDAETTYAVRSSATAEDRPTASFAGQHETFLGVAATDVLSRVRDCMASLFTDRAVAYRARNDISHTDVEMAVVVQEMVAADAAGVLFTADPTTGKRTVATVDATYGLGETVVAGEVSADHVRFDRERSEILDYVVGEKATERRLSEAGLTAGDTRSDRRDTRVLTETQLRTLVALGERIEELFGEPQDIEWALLDGGFVVLQSRPITSLVALPQPRPDDRRLHLYVSLGHGQAMTDPMPPLALDIWETMYEDVLNHVTGGDRIWITRSEGRLYMDITPFLGFALTRRGVVETIDEISPSAARGTERLLEERRDELRGERSLAALPTVLRTSVGVLPLVARVLWGGAAPLFRGSTAVHDLVDELDAYAREQEAEIVDAEEPRELVESVFGGFPTEFAVEIAPKMAPALVGPFAGRVLERLTPGADATLLEAAARGNEEEVGTRMTLALGDLADIARETPAVERAILDGESYEEIRAIDGSEAFVQRFEAFREAFGHRAAGEFDLSRPRWRDDPSGPLGIVRGNLVGEEPGAHRERLDERKRAAQTAIDELQEGARGGLLGPVRGPLVSHLLETYRSYVHLRDEPKHAVAHVFAAWHEAIQRVGEQLVHEGVLDEADDVWYLHRGELLSLVDEPESELPDIAARKQDHRHQERLEAPPIVTSEGEIPHAEREDAGENSLVGTGISSGVVEGTARIVHDPANTTLRAGDILVSPSSDPAWTPLFATASGLVTEVGGSLTHGALVAREYGLPAVASVTGATETISDGQRIRVDGDDGTVELLDE